MVTGAVQTQEQNPGFPSGEWIRRRFLRLAPVDTGAGSVTVQYVVEDLIQPSLHFQVYEQGRLAKWLPGTHPNPDVWVCQPVHIARAFLTAVGDPAAVLEGTTILEAPNGAKRYPVPPLDERGVGPHSFAGVPGAGVSLRLILSHSPFGTVDIVQRFVNGRRTQFQVNGDQDVEVEGVGVLTYEAYVRYRTGEISLMEALEGGEPNGSWPKLMLAAGLIDDPAYRTDVEYAAASPRARRGLATLGEIVSSPNYVDALEDLAASGC